MDRERGPWDNQPRRTAALPNKSETDLALRPRHDEGRREEVALPAAIGFDGHHEVPADMYAMKSNFKYDTCRKGDDFILTCLRRDAT